MLATIPYGIIADKYGRKPVMFLGMLGVFLYSMFSLLPRKYILTPLVLTRAIC